MALLLAMTVGLFVLRHTVHKKYDNPNAPLYFQMLNACIVEFLNAIIVVFCPRGWARGGRRRPNFRGLVLGCIIDAEFLMLSLL